MKRVRLTFVLATDFSVGLPPSADWTEGQVLELRRAGRSSERIAKLLEALVALDGHVRILAAETLARWGTHPDRALPVLSAVLDSAGNPATRNARYAEQWLRVAAGAIGHYGSEALPALPSLVAVLSDSDYNVRGYAARSLGSIGKLARRALPALDRALRNETVPEVRKLMAEAVTKIRAVE